MMDQELCPPAPAVDRTRRNVELKARLESLDHARQVAVSLATDRLASQHQIDTYFVCDRGRLKLREIDGRRSQLIWYVRPDHEEPRTSDYMLVELPQDNSLRNLLISALGEACRVEKQREIFLYRNVRIHLDRVVGLGTYLEFEAVLHSPAETDEGARQVAWLRERFGISPGSLVSGSYSDLLQQAAAGRIVEPRRDG